MIWGFNYTEDLFKCLRTSSLNPLNYTESKVYIRTEHRVDSSKEELGGYIQFIFTAAIFCKNGEK